MWNYLNNLKSFIIGKDQLGGGCSQAELKFFTADFHVNFELVDFALKYNYSRTSCCSLVMQRESCHNKAGCVNKIRTHVNWSETKTIEQSRQKVMFADSELVNNCASGKRGASFLGILTFFKSSDANAADVFYFVPLRITPRANSSLKHCSDWRAQTTVTKSA